MAKQHHLKQICIFSAFTMIIPTDLLCQMKANTPEVEFQGAISKFRKRSKISSLLLYVLHKMWN